MWSPANRAERALAWAISPRDYPRYFRVLATIDLLQPLGPESKGLLRRRLVDGRQPITVKDAGRTVLPVFTSFEAMDMAMEKLTQAGVLDADVVEAGAVVRLPYLRETWPNPRWWLAIDPWFPIGAYLKMDAINRALRDEVAEPDDPEILVGDLTSGEWEPWPEGANQAVLQAVERGEAAEYLDALMDLMVTISTTREVTGDDWPGAGYPWRPIGSPPDQVVEVFTDPEACAAAYPGLPNRTVRFFALVLHWQTRYGLSVNPGGPAGLDLPGPHVPVLREWVLQAGRQGLDVPIPRQVENGMRWVRERDWSHVYLPQETPSEEAESAGSDWNAAWQRYRAARPAGWRELFRAGPV